MEKMKKNDESFSEIILISIVERCSIVVSALAFGAGGPQLKSR